MVAHARPPPTVDLPAPLGRERPRARARAAVGQVRPSQSPWASPDPTAHTLQSSGGGESAATATGAPRCAAPMGCVSCPGGDASLLRRRCRGEVGPAPTQAPHTAGPRRAVNCTGRTGEWARGRGRHVLHLGGPHRERARQDAKRARPQGRGRERGQERLCVARAPRRRLLDRVIVGGRRIGAGGGRRVRGGAQRAHISCAGCIAGMFEQRPECASTAGAYWANHRPLRSHLGAAMCGEAVGRRMPRL